MDKEGSPFWLLRHFERLLCQLFLTFSG
uniref:Uncharacterized protein n=1 Tax=Arundo donax TaxID=35708 RepID=A0A0A8YL09_ARUDO